MPVWKPAGFIFAMYNTIAICSHIYIFLETKPEKVADAAHLIFLFLLRKKALWSRAGAGYNITGWDAGFAGCSTS